MSNINCHVQQIDNKFKIQITPLIKNADYALYVLVKAVGETQFKRVYRYGYKKNNIFYYNSNLYEGEIIFQFFVKINDELLCNNSTKINIKYRKLVPVNRLSFEKSFDLDVLNRYRLPVKFNRINDHKKCIVLLNGALSSKNTSRYPIYSRGSWGGKFNINILNIFDGTLDITQDYLLAWYQGTVNNPLFPDIIDIIEKLKKDCSLVNKNLVFYGSSGGGWAALKLAEYFPEATAVAINPQISILDYNIKSALNKFISVTFQDMNVDLIRSLYKDRLTINPSFFIKDSRFIIVQNKQDLHHYREHFYYFWKNFSDEVRSGWDRNKQNYCILYDHPSGHGGEPEEVFSEIMGKLKYFL